MKKLIFVLLVISLIIGGCGYSTELENQAFVVAVGIDKGKQFPLKATFVFANPGGSSGGGGNSSGGGEEKSPSSPSPDIVTVEAPTVFSAVRKLDSIKSKAINLSHIKIIVFSDTIASEGIKKYLSGFASSRDFRPNTYICVSKGDANEYLKSVKPSQETFIEKYYDNIMHKVAADKVNEAYLYYLYFNVMEKFSGSLVPLVGVNKNEMENPASAINPGSDDFAYEARAGEILRDAKNPAEVLGAAIFRNDKMIGTLGSFQTDLARIICDEYYPRNYSIEYPEESNFVTIRLIQQKSPDIKSDIKGNQGNIHISIPVSIEYVDAGKIENHEQKSAHFCKYLEEVLSEETKKLIKSSQTEFNSDILGLGDSLKIHFPDEKLWERWNWEEKYPSAKINVSFDVTYADFEEAN